MIKAAFDNDPGRNHKNWRKYTLAYVKGPQVTLKCRPVHTESLTAQKDGGIDLKKIAPEKRVY